MTPPLIRSVTNHSAAIAQASKWDCVVWIRGADTGTVDAALAQLWDSWQTLSGASGGVGLMAAPALAGGRLIIAPTGPLWRERDDVRRFAKAGADGLARAAGIGAARPLLLVTGIPAGPKYKYALAVAALAAQASCWVPLEGREANNISSCVSEIGLTCIDDDARPEAWEAWLNAVENGRWLARDLCGTEPERMAPLRFAHDCEQVFASTSVRVETIYSGPAFAANYPLLNAVARASLTVPRHHPCVVRLEYKPQGPVERTLLFAGKGVTYDTGGADLKTGGSMAGMSRDKGGAAAVAGLMRTIAELAPPGIHAIAELGLVRNSIGADAFVSDEIITSHAGKRVRIGNTDAEGRLVLADLLSHLREQATTAINPRLFSVATLTGHAARAIGPYTAIVENEAARALGTGAELERVGDLIGDAFDPQRLRPEDWDFIAAKSAAEDLISCNNAASSATPRGHQFPAAFLAIAAGLESTSDDATTLAFTHLDIAGSAIEQGWAHGRPSARPLVGMLAALLADQLPS